MLIPSRTFLINNQSCNKYYEIDNYNIKILLFTIHKVSVLLSTIFQLHQVQFVKSLVVKTVFEKVSTLRARRDTVKF